jgi:type I restriction enzyme S subunit
MLKFCWETEFKKTEMGEIPRDWEIRELKDIAKIESGGNAPQEEKYFLNAKYPFIRVKHLNTDKYISDYDLINEEAVRDYNLKLFEKNTIVFAKSGESINLGKYNIIPFDAYIVNHLAVIKNIQNLSEIDFLFYVLIAFDRFVEKDIAGTTLPYLKITDIEKKKIFYPPLSEQSRIATVLSWFDDLIEVKRRQNEILEKTAIAIFKSWFIDFEPFKNEEFVYNEELGKEIPKGWEVKKIIDFSNIVSGRGRYLIEAKGGIYPLWGANGILGYIENYDLEGLSIITGRVGTLGNVFLVEGKFAISDNVLCLIPNQSIWIFFLYLWLKSQVDFESLNVGTSQPLITKTAIGHEPIIFPPPHILQSFHSLVEPLFQKIILNQKQIMTLRKIRDTLLPLLVFGKLRVEEI